jgi:hypothetical protein
MASSASSTVGLTRRVTRESLRPVIDAVVSAAQRAVRAAAAARTRRTARTRCSGSRPPRRRKSAWPGTRVSNARAQRGCKLARLLRRVRHGLAFAKRALAAERRQLQEVAPLQRWWWHRGGAAASGSKRQASHGRIARRRRTTRAQACTRAHRGGWRTFRRCTDAERKGAREVGRQRSAPSTWHSRHATLSTPHHACCFVLSGALNCRLRWWRR